MSDKSEIAVGAVGTNVVRFWIKRLKWLEDLEIQQAIRLDSRPDYLVAKAYGVCYQIIERIRTEHTTPQPMRTGHPQTEEGRKQKSEKGRIAIRKRWDNSSPEQRTAIARAAALKRWARVRAARENPEQSGS